MLNSLGCLVKMIVGTSQDSHSEQVEENWIVNMGLINMLEPLHSSDHIHSQSVIKEKVQVHIPPPPIVNNSLIIWFPLPDSMEGILGDLSILHQCSIRRKQRGELPHKSTGSAQSLTLGYEPSHPINGCCLGANWW